MHATTAPDTDASQRLAHWLAASATGDHAAFRCLHRATHQRLLLVALEVLGARERAEEALQEAYLKVWRHAGQFDPQLARPMTWLMRIVQRTAIDHWRARHGEQGLTVPLSDPIAETLQDPAASPEQQCADSGLRRQVLAALSRLPRAERHAAGLVLMHGCTPAEAARASGLPDDQGRLPLRRALSQLRRQFAPRTRTGAAALAA